MAFSPRDPARIDEILEYLRRSWIYQPDTRLAQLIINISGVSEAMPELYHMEDKELLVRLRKESERAAAHYLTKGEKAE